jgi:hypothetical protein
MLRQAQHEAATVPDMPAPRLNNFLILSLSKDEEIRHAAAGGTDRPHSKFEAA